MKTFYRKNLVLSLLLVIFVLIIGTATAGCVSSEPAAKDIGLKQVPYDINGVFTTASGMSYNSSSGVFDLNNQTIVYAVSQHDRLFKITEDDSSVPLFFAIDDKQGKHFFSHKKDGNTTLYLSGIIKSDDVFSMKTITSSGGVVKVHTALAVRDGAEVPDDSEEVPDITGTWATAQSSVYQINSQEENVFSGRITVHGKTTSTRFAGYIDTVDDDGTTRVVMLCEKGNFILGDLNLSTHNITIPYVLYANGKISSSSLTEDMPEWATTNRTVTQECATILNSDRITENTSKQTRLLSVYDESAGRYTLTSASDNIEIIGVVQGNNSFIEYSPDTGLIRGFVKGNIKYDFRGKPEFAEKSIHNLNQAII